MARFKNGQRRKVSGVASADSGRPVLHGARVSQREESWYLELTDSYQLARVELEAEEGDGLFDDARLPYEALKALDRPRSSFTLDAEAGTVTVTSGSGKSLKAEVFPFGDGGRFPNVDSLWLDAPTEEEGTFRVALNAEFLLSLAGALGDCHTKSRPAQVTLEFRGGDMRDGTTVRPILVWGSDSDPEGERGLLMPIRVDREPYVAQAEAPAEEPVPA